MESSLLSTGTRAKSVRHFFACSAVRSLVVQAAVRALRVRSHDIQCLFLKIFQFALLSRRSPLVAENNFFFLKKAKTYTNQMCYL